MIDEMKEIVTCKFCGNPEYYGMMHWHNGTTMCRKCIYGVWSVLNSKWTPGKHDYTFPLYEDGKNYTRIKYDRFQPCEHVGCLNHIFHPCEGCGRIGGNGIIYENIRGD